MKRIIFLLATVAFFAGCGGGSSVELSPEMTEFTGMIQGTSDNVTDAVAKFASNEELKSNDITYYDLKDPNVISKEGDCYHVEFTAGITTRMYDICWADGKISSIEDKGMK